MNGAPIGGCEEWWWNWWRGERDWCEVGGRFGGTEVERGVPANKHKLRCVSGQLFNPFRSSFGKRGAMILLPPGAPSFQPIPLLRAALASVLTNLP